MYLFIFESIGTSELLLIGIIALIFLGPRKLPEIARKIGKIMAEFRSTTHDFKSTWEREVNFEEEAKAFDVDALENEHERKRELEESTTTDNAIGAPLIKEIDKESFERASDRQTTETNEIEETGAPPEDVDVLSDKRTWL